MLSVPRPFVSDAWWLARPQLCKQRNTNGKPRPIKLGALALGLRQAACGPAPGRPPLRSPTQPVEHQSSRRLLLQPLVTFRQALRTLFPEAMAWTEWQHQSESSLSPQALAAEQGDVLGTIQSAVVLGQERDTHLENRPHSFWCLRRMRGAQQREELRASALPARAQVGVCGESRRTCMTPLASSAWTRFWLP